MRLIRDLLKLAATKLVVTEMHNDPDLEEKRSSICATCPNNKDGVCSVCGCFLEVKVKAKTNRTKTGRIEVTHCPLGKWDDQDLVEYYKQN